MKVRIFRDEKGKVLASSEISNEKEISVALQPTKGHTMEEVDAADKYQLDLKGFYKKHERAIS